MLTKDEMTCDQSRGKKITNLIITLLFLSIPVTLFGANINNFSIELVEQHRGAHWDTLMHYADQGEDSVLIRWYRGSGDSVRIMMGIFGYPRRGYGRHVVTYPGPIDANPTHSLMIHLPEPSLVYFMAYVYDSTAIADRESTTVYVPNDHGGFPQLFAQHFGDTFQAFVVDTTHSSAEWDAIMKRILVLDAVAEGLNSIYQTDPSRILKTQQAARLMDTLFVLKKTERRSHDYVQFPDGKPYGLPFPFYKEGIDSVVSAFESGDKLFAEKDVTTFAEEVDSTETDITVTSADSIGDATNPIHWIWAHDGSNYEIMRVDSKVADTITVKRGLFATDEQAYSNGDTLHIIVAECGGFDATEAQLRMENRDSEMIADPFGGSGLNWPQMYAYLAHKHITGGSSDSLLICDGRRIYDGWMNDNWCDAHGSGEDYNDYKTFNYLSAYWDSTLESNNEHGLTGNLTPTKGEFATATSWAGLEGGNFTEPALFITEANRFPDDTVDYLLGRDVLVEKIENYRTSKGMWFETRDNHVNPFCAEWITDKSINGDDYVQATRMQTILASCLDGMVGRKHWTGSENTNPFRWLEEWAVNDSGKCFTYDDTVGSALACTTTAYRHWLGEPLEDFQYEFRSGWAAVRSDISGRFETTNSDSDFSVSGDITAVGRSQDFAHSGNYSYACTVDVDETGGTFNSATVTGTLFDFEADSIYTISFWTLMDSTRFFRWDVKDNNSTVLRSVQNASGSPGGVWTQHVSWFITPDTSTSATFNIYLGKEFGQRGDLFYLDDVLIKPTRGWMGLTREFENGFILLNQDPSYSNLFMVPSNCRVLEGVASSYYYSTDTLHNTDSLVTGSLLKVGPENGYMLIYDP